MIGKQCYLYFMDIIFNKKFDVHQIFRKNILKKYKYYERRKVYEVIF